MKPSHLLTLAALLALFAFAPLDRLPDVLPTPTADLPIQAEGFHCVALRRHGQILSAGQTAVLGSQDLEEAVEKLGGTYRVLWDDETPPAEYAEAFAQMKAAGVPQWCLCNSETRRYLLEPVPDSVDTGLELVNEIGGGA